jgi:RNA polymerase sigma-70 factor (ECF subfamily)
VESSAAQNGSRAKAAPAGAEHALTELYRGAYRRLVLQLFAFTTDLTEAQDVVQEAFARALARPRGLSDVENPEAWLRTVAINVVRRRWRRRKLMDTILLRERPVQAFVQAAPEPDRADLREALAAVPRVYREVVVLHYLADLPVDEVATLLGVPAGTVKSRLSRARAALAAHLDGYRPATPAQSSRSDQSHRSALPATPANQQTQPATPANQQTQPANQPTQPARPASTAEEVSRA